VEDDALSLMGLLRRLIYFTLCGELFALLAHVFAMTADESDLNFYVYDLTFVSLPCLMTTCIL
jgi:hypothetical protein